MATDAINSTSATTISHEENHNISDISNAAHSMYPLQPPIPSQTQQMPTTLDDFINTPLTIDEKRKLRFDLLSLPPEKLGEIMYVLQKSQPQNIEQKGDELEIDLKKLNTKTLRHLQRYVESVFAKVRYNSMVSNQQQPMFIPQMNEYQQQPHKRLSVGDLLPNNRKRSYHAIAEYENNINGYNDGYRPQRKKRSAFTSKQKEEMIQFWKTVNWQAIPDDQELAAIGQKIGVTVPQLKVFRQNNRKKYGKATASSNETSPLKNTNANTNTAETNNQQEIVKEEEIVEIGKVENGKEDEKVENVS